METNLKGGLALYRKTLTVLLLLSLFLSLSAPAFAAEGQEAPPQAEVMEDAPQAEEVPPAADMAEPAPEAAPIAEEETAEDALPIEETAPAAEAPAEETPVEDAPQAAAAQGVTVNLTGVTDPVDTLVVCEDMAGELRRYCADEGVPVPLSVSVRPGSEVRLFMDPAYDVTVDNATVETNHLFSQAFAQGPGDNGHQRYNLSTFRSVYLTVPQQGTVTVNVAATQDALPELVPYVFYNNKWYGYDEGGGVVGGVSPDDPYQYGGIIGTTGHDGTTIATGSVIEIWTAPGFEMEVLEGGHIADTHKPTGPAASDIPAGSTAYVLMVDYGAKAFVIACVKQGEHYQVPSTMPQGEATPWTDTGTDAAPQTGSTFTDVASGAWYESQVMSAYEKGIVRGVSDTTFDPNGTTTRGQTVTMLYRAMGSPGGANVFSDTSGEVGSAAGWAASAGVTTGISDTTFAPNNAITREQLVTMLYRLAGSPAAASAASVLSYTDSGEVQSYAKDAVAWAISNGLLTGYGDGTIRPSGVATRAEVCALIMRFVG